MDAHVVSQSVRTRIRSLKHGEHLCCFYDHADEQLGVTVEYIKEGLRRNERCLYASDRASLTALRGALAGQVDVDAESARGALILLTKDQAHLANGRFDMKSILALLGQVVGETLTLGFSGLRAVGDMSWILDEAPGTDQVAEYESLVNDFYADVPAIGLCLYDRKRLDPGVLDDALRTHPTVLAQHMCFDANPFYEAPNIFMNRADGIERFAWKLGRLAALTRAGAEAY